VKNGFSIAWKTAAAALVSYSLVAGLMSPVPRLFILNETIRNLYFHVPMWFTMVALMGVSLGYSIGSLRKPGISALESDRKARLAAEVALVFAFLGLFTGMIWARFTWGAYWTNDPKLNGTAVAILIYLAYFVLRSSVEDPEKKARVASTYNVFAFVLMIVFIGVLPRLNPVMMRFLQQAPPVEMADAFRADGKIWVVVAVVAIIFVGLLAYLTWLDLRLRKAEQSAHSAK